MFRALDVTKKNFPDVLPEIKQAIDSCDFLTIDTELTGLYNSKSSEHAFDTMEERYSKLKEHCSKILIIQFGLSTFKYHPEEKKYTHRDFNFYVFPPSHLRLTPDPKFVCQTSSIHFLASYGFDFNKVIYEGIPYLTLQDEEKAKDYVNNKYKNVRNSISTPKEASEQKTVEIPEEHKEFIEKINKQVDAFISNECEVVIHLDPCSSYRRKLIYDSIQQKHKTGIEMTSKVNKDNERFIAIVKCTEQDKLNKVQAQEDIDLDDVDRNVGFRKVMDYISESKKLVIGHNMYLDVLHTIEQFFFPLPDDLQDFKNMCRMTFPHILDTKCLASSEKLRPLLESTQLGKILKAVHENPFGLPKIEPEGGNKGYDLATEHPHEAGFDALMTGICFIGLSKKLASLENFKVDHVGPSHKVLKPFTNRIHVMKHFDTYSLNLAGPDPEPKRENVFYVSFPEEWKRIDLVELFLPYGEIYVDWLDDVSALVALKNPENTLSAKKNLVNKTSNLYKVRLYNDYNKWCHSQSNSNQDKSKRSVQTTDKSTGTKRRNSASEDGCNMEQIPEVDENEVETKENSDVPPPSKKLKPIPEESETPPKKLFEEEVKW